MDVLSVKGLCKKYESFELSDVSFAVKKGEIMGFIGRNGAGKTTTLKSLLNFVHPDSGDIEFFGKRFPNEEFEIKQRLGFVSGGVDYYVHKKLRVITAVTKTFYEKWDDAAYIKYTKMFALDENKTPGELSAGMKVKYNLALALSHRAELLILDEPTSGLDPVSRDDLLDVFLNLAREGVSILFSTHITSDLDKCADRITYIKNGKIIASEDLTEFTGRYLLMEFGDTVPDSLNGLLIGHKLAKHGSTAIISRSDANRLGVSGKSCDLETIMVHMEKE